MGSVNLRDVVGHLELVFKISFGGFLEYVGEARLGVMV